MITQSTTPNSLKVRPDEARELILFIDRLEDGKDYLWTELFLRLADTPHNSPLINVMAIFADLPGTIPALNVLNAVAIATGADHWQTLRNNKFQFHRVRVAVRRRLVELSEGGAPCPQ